VKKTKPTFSSRVPILRRVLDCINSREYDNQGDYMIFGSDLDEIISSLCDGYQRPQDADAVRVLLSDLKTDLGRKHAARRTSIDAAAGPQRLRGMEGLSPQSRQMFVDAAQSAPPFRPPSEAVVIDHLDAYYAQELLGKIDRIVGRASALQELDPKDVSNRDLCEYFNEAHRCFLYGFRIAAAVLCRSILETALKDLIDPDGKIEQEMRRHGSRSDSYFKKLLNAARSRLRDDRPDCAIRVNDAGRYAVHDLSEFNKMYPAEKASQILDDTRKVLLDLYGPEKLTELSSSG
jgi:hypothetical protein